MSFTEDLVEQAALDIIQELGWRYEEPFNIAPDGPNRSRTSNGDVVLARLLEGTARRLNPDIPDETLAVCFEASTGDRNTLSYRREPAHSPATG